MINEKVLNNFRADQILINAARGPVVDNQALQSSFTKKLMVLRFWMCLSLNLKLTCKVLPLAAQRLT